MGKTTCHKYLPACRGGGGGKNEEMRKVDARKRERKIEGRKKRKEKKRKRKEKKKEKKKKEKKRKEKKRKEKKRKEKKRKEKKRKEKKRKEKKRKKKKKEKKKKKVFSTGDSNVVTHHSTNPAHRCLTSEFRWDRVLSPGYDRRQAFLWWLSFCESKVVHRL